MSNRRRVTVTTGSRLHFGMFSFGHPSARQFGGVGAMTDAPGVCVRVSHADRLQASGPMSQRALEAARHVMRAWGEASPLPCTIEVLHAPRLHVGLGTGTQLALAVARGLHAFFQRECPTAGELARRAARGRRSAIGLHGFWHGGLLMEGGKLQPEEISPLVARVELPEEWRWVLITPRQSSGVSGAGEQAAFERLPPVPEDLTAQLRTVAEEELLPAATRGDLAAFSRSLFRFGQLAGRCFQSQQGGVYATPQTAEMVETIRRCGVEGVGQSSWGPTLFALTRDERAGLSLAEALNRGPRRDLEITIARPLNAPAAVGVTEV